jgi:choline dehydrogenase-like flavoprotein
MSEAEAGIVLGTRIEADRRERADVIVIGSGAGGASTAMRFAEAGKKVLVLERGGYYTGLLDPLDRTRLGHGTLNQREDDMLARIDGGRGFTTTEDGLANLTYGNCVGGATVHYWADSYRTPPDRLELWERDFGVEGHSADELAPYFAEIERDLGIHPATSEYYNVNNLLFRQGIEALGWRGEPVPQARRGCSKSGHCMQGCSFDAKQSMLVTYIPRAVHAGAVVYADCRVDGITTEARPGCWPPSSTVRPRNRTARSSSRVRRSSWSRRVASDRRRSCCVRSSRTRAVRWARTCAPTSARWPTDSSKRTW